MHGGAADDRWNWSVQGDQLRLCIGGGIVDGKPVAANEGPDVNALCRSSAADFRRIGG